MNAEQNKIASIGFYGGSFDPIHNGHINMALELMEACHLSEIFFCPTYLSPHKQESTKTSGEHRLNMVELAIRDIPGFTCLDREIKREGPSFTIDTLEELLEIEEKSGNTRQLYLILGDDTIEKFHTWHRVKDIVNLVPLLIGRRLYGDADKSFSSDPLLSESIMKGLVPSSQMDISATNIRQRLLKGRYCGHLAPQKVLDYIYQNQLYYTVPN